jgi:hypothetical protein
LCGIWQCGDTRKFWGREIVVRIHAGERHLGSRACYLPTPIGSAASSLTDGYGPFLEPRWITVVRPHPALIGGHHHSVMIAEEFRKRLSSAGF